jgi:two-component system OmpR family response regulator
MLRFNIVSKITRSEIGFTQGLEVHDDRLYESTGRIGGTTRLDLISFDGKVTQTDLGTTVFGEGLTILKDEVFQLTWQEHQVFVYDLGGKIKREMHNPRDGWGLSNDGTDLIFSDGGPSIYYADPRTFVIRKSVRIRTNRPGDVEGLNELELVGGKLFGNIFTTRAIVRLDPASGCIDGLADSLVIEDEPQIGAYLGRLLGQLRGIVDIVASVSEAEQALGNFKYDLAIVDRMLPDADALDLVTALSQLPERPAFILLTARDAKEDLIDGLNSGADDYLSKPFEPQEFIARVRAVLRRPRLLVPSILSFGNVELHVGANEVTVANNKVLLRRREALILEALLMRRERVIPRDALIEAIYGFDDEFESNTLEAQVSRLRKKLGEVGGNVEIRAMRGIGYILRMAQT